MTFVHKKETVSSTVNKEQNDLQTMKITVNMHEGSPPRLAAREEIRYCTTCSPAPCHRRSRRFNPAVRVEVDQESSTIFTYQNSWIWKCNSRSWCITFAVAPFDGNYLASYLIAIVMFAFSSLLKLALQKFDLENVGQCHGVQCSQWSRSMANMNLYKSHILRADIRHIEFGWLLGNSAVHRSLVYFDYICLVVDSLVLHSVRAALPCLAVRLSAYLLLWTQPSIYLWVFYLSVSLSLSRIV